MSNLFSTIQIHRNYLLKSLGKLLAYALLWTIAGVLFAVIERGVIGSGGIYPSVGGTYDFWNSLLLIATFTFLSGILLASFDVFYFNLRFEPMPFTRKLILKATLHMVVIIIMIFTVSLVFNTLELQRPFYSPTVLRETLEFFSNFAFWSIFIYASFMSILFQYIFEVVNSIGTNVAVNFLTGKYHEPVEEERIFMFLDLKDSTAIAEKIGHLNYFRLIKSYYSDISKSILKYDGEIYQYVGDEIVISWKLKDNVSDGNFLNCFFDMQKNIEGRREYYLKKYKAVPQFKAGVHCGRVSAGEIGVLKKDILFSGDVLNTASRIQALCNELNEKLLISEEMLKFIKIPQKDIYYAPKLQGTYQLKGKHNQIVIYAIRFTHPTEEKPELNRVTAAN